MYASTNFPTKKALKEAVNKANAGQGPSVTVYDPSGFSSTPSNGTVSLEGPHSPKPHTWYARATLKDGVVVKVS